MFATSTTVTAHAVGVFLRLSIVPVRTKTSPNGFTLCLRCPSAARPAKTSDCATTSVSPPTKLHRFERVLDGFTANLILALNLSQCLARPRLHLHSSQAVLVHPGQGHRGPVQRS